MNPITADPRTAAVSTVPADERLTIRAAMTRATAMLKLRTGRSSVAFIADLTGTNESTAKAYLNGLRRPSVTFVRDLAAEAGVPATELFVALGWLPPDEAAALDARGLARQVLAAADTLRRLEPHARHTLDSGRLTTPALFAAGAAVLADPDTAGRFDVRLFHTVSEGRYRAVTHGVAEFTLRPGCRPRPATEVDPPHLFPGGDWGLDPENERVDPGFWWVRRELWSRIQPALCDADLGEVVWQGEPGTRAWSAEAQTWPAHLLVQDAYGSVPRAGHPDAWQPAAVPSVVVVGDRYSGATAAALLAEGLGGEFVPVPSEIGPGSTGSGAPAGRGRLTGAGRWGWESVARRIERCHRDGHPWRAVVLLPPPAVSGGSGYAAELLANTTARIGYVRPPQGLLTWWALRQQGALPPGRFDPVRWIGRTKAALHAAEEALSGRAVADLHLAIPEPGNEVAAIGDTVPDALVDAQARVAWTLLHWLDEVAGGAAEPIRNRLLPGALADWVPELSADPDGRIPPLR